MHGSSTGIRKPASTFSELLTTAQHARISRALNFAVGASVAQSWQTRYDTNSDRLSADPAGTHDALAQRTCHF